MHSRTSFMGGSAVPLRGLGAPAMTLTYEQAKLWAQEFLVMLAAHPECANDLTRRITDTVGALDAAAPYLTEAQLQARRAAWSIEISAGEVEAYRAFKACTGQQAGGTTADGFPALAVGLGGLAALGILMYAASSGS